ncbi:MAG: anaerobic carbon-monoxide dehydrogenase catalytic subunit [Dehalococcoidia bacterium]|nr:anaerobic carbon-monoxide dehydrogenase catalytic subunit [Dehalococcoidia bacterium]
MGEKERPFIKSIDPTTVELLDICATEGVDTIFQRADAVKACPIGGVAACCKSCFMGPCRLTGKTQTGLCGATRATVAARNYARAIAGGAAAHSDHGRDMALTLLAACEGHAPDFKVKDQGKMIAVAELLGIKTKGRSNEEIGKEIALKALGNFSSTQKELDYLRRAPLKRQAIWRKLGIAPRGIDREVVEMMHRTTAGVDQDAEHIMSQALRTALSDGWGGSMLGTDISDILFGTPGPVQARANFGVLSNDDVNVVIHGHEPNLSMMMVEAASNPEIIEYAKSKGAKGINLAGMCCTANKILMRQGVSLLGNFLSQEFAMVTGAVEAMVVDIQCVMEGLVAVAGKYHTEIISTSPKAKITGSTYMEFDEEHGLEHAEKILRRAIDNFPNRKKTRIPNYVNNLVAGFSHEYINYMLGGSFRQSLRPLIDNIANGRIRGAAGVVGCNNARLTQDDYQTYIVRELIKNDILVVTTGCNAIADAKQGLLTPEMMTLAGPGLREICQTIGIPPVLHMGSCVDNSRILTLLAQCATEGGLGEDISDAPVVGFAPEWMSEKAVSIGTYFVASGVTTWMIGPHPFSNSPEVMGLLTEGYQKKVGAALHFEPDVEKALQATIALIDAKRAVLKLDRYDPERYKKSEAYFPADYTSDEVFTEGRYTRSRT